MDAIQPDEIYLEREFEGCDADGNTSVIRLIMGKPHYVDVRRWRCHFQILGIGHQKIRATDGLDSIDALLMSLRMAQTLIEYFAKEEHKIITWLGMDDLGFSPGRQ